VQYGTEESISVVGVTSWIALVFMDKRNDPRSHTNYTRIKREPNISRKEAKITNNVFALPLLLLGAFAGTLVKKESGFPDPL
jgi:hypothetical protein